MPSTTQPPAIPARLHLKVIYRHPDELKPDPRNARRRSRAVERKLDKSMSTFGFVVPVLLDQNGKVIVGHGRIAASRRLGLTEIPTIALEHLTPAQAKALQIADNRLAELGEWDEQLLGEALLDLSLQDLDFDLDVTGFEMAEIDLKIAGLDDAPMDEDVPPVVAPDAVAVSRPGDLWRLRSHHILCADALEEEMYACLLAGETADIVVTDSPYNVPISGHVGGLGAVRHREFAMASGEMKEAEFDAFLEAVCLLAASSLRPGGLAYMFMDWRHIAALLAAGKSALFDLINLCVWAKTAAGMGSFYRSQHELVAVFRKRGASHRNNVQLGRFGRSRSNLWTYPGMTGFGRNTEEGDLLALHPTCKSVPMLADILLDATARGDIVLDPFLGSGSTLIAAERVGRRAYGIEIDPLYVDVAIRRWQRLTGEAAVHAASGRTFNDIEKEGRP